VPRLTVLTYNIHHAVGMDGQLDIDRLAAVIGDAEADLIGLQEVDRGYGPRSDYLDELELLADSLGLTGLFCGTLPADPPGGTDADSPTGASPLAYGNALLTRHPVHAWRNCWLPGRPGLEPRRLLIAAVATPIGPVRVGVSHLSYENGSVRRSQVAQVCRLLDQDNAGAPRVLMGDFNDTPRSRDLAGFRTTYTDSWIEAGVGRGYTIDAARPHKRIDYVLHDAALTACTAITPATTASDHRPVRVVLQPVASKE
jgi:endonuclease/exonuclease/phosphatase family metal-dependent hydrolase